MAEAGDGRVCGCRRGWGGGRWSGARLGEQGEGLGGGDGAGPVPAMGDVLAGVAVVDEEDGCAGVGGDEGDGRAGEEAEGGVPEAAQDAVLRQYVHLTEGLDHRFGRTHLNSCEFSVATWACAEVPEDLTLEGRIPPQRSVFRP